MPLPIPTFSNSALCNEYLLQDLSNLKGVDTVCMHVSSMEEKKTIRVDWKVKEESKYGNNPRDE